MKCMNCGKKLVKRNYSQPADKPIEKGETIFKRYKDAWGKDMIRVWTGIHNGYGRGKKGQTLFCTLRCGMRYAERILNK